MGCRLNSLLRIAELTLSKDQELFELPISLVLEEQAKKSSDLVKPISSPTTAKMNTSIEPQSAARARGATQHQPLVPAQTMQSENVQPPTK